MPFSSNAGSFFGRFGPVQSEAPSGQSGINSIIASSTFKTPNLFETIQAVRQNELERQTKQAAIAKALYELQQAPMEQELKNRAVAVQELQNKIALSKLPLEEVSNMSRGGYVQTSNNMPNRQELLGLGMSPEARVDRRNILKGRTEYGDPGAIQGVITGRRYVPKSTASEDTQLQVDPGVAQKIANYQVDIKAIPGFGKSSVRNAYLKEAVKLNPSYDQKQFLAAQKFMTGLADTKRGTPGGIVNSANTLLGHLDYLDSMTDDLKNSGLPSGNLIKNFAKFQLGHPDITNYKQALEVVNSEMETLLSGVGVTQEGLRARRVLLNENSSYDQQKAAIKTLIDVMKKRIAPIQDQYKRYGGEDDSVILSDESKGIINRISGNNQKSGFRVVRVRNK